ncbi:MAG: S8 family peptidase [Myxococcaceae bacterium]
MPNTPKGPLPGFANESGTKPLSFGSEVATRNVLASPTLGALTSPMRKPETVVILKPNVRDGVQVELTAKRRKPAAALSRTANLLGIQGSSVLDELSQNFVKPRGGAAGFLATSVSRAALSLRAGEPSEDDVEPVEYFPALGVLVGTVERVGLAALRRDSRVDEIGEAPDLELIRPLADGTQFAEPPDAIAWGLRAMNIPKLWARGFTGKGVLIGHLDTGVDSGHPAFKGRIRSHVVVDPKGRAVRSKTKAADTGSHGTHTAGTLVGRPAKGGHRIGVAPEAKLATATVIEEGNCFRRVIRGLQWALEQDVRVVNLSLGFRKHETKPIMRRILQVVRARGALPVCAIGNDGPTGPVRYPGAYEEALSVGSSNQGGQRSSFSSHDRVGGQSIPLVLAPGEAIVSAKPGGGYFTDSGTSMAAPHISGLAALLLHAWPRATVDQLQRAIVRSANALGVPDAVQAEALLAASLKRKKRRG